MYALQNQTRHALAAIMHGLNTTLLRTCRHDLPSGPPQAATQPSQQLELRWASSASVGKQAHASSQPSRHGAPRCHQKAQPRVIAL